MSYQRVGQIHNDGCFVAAVAMLLGKTYGEALKLVHPKKCIADASVGIRSSVMSEAALAQQRLSRLGIKVTISRERRIRRIKRDAILIIRWTVLPTLLHMVLYVAEEERFLDPSSETPLYLSEYQSQLDSVMLIDAIPIKVKNETSYPNYGMANYSQRQEGACAP